MTAGVARAARVASNHQKGHPVDTTGRLLSLVVLAAATSGCTTSGYLRNRERDLVDVVTCTVGLGAGAKARVGPLHAGLFGASDQRGLRGGVFHADMHPQICVRRKGLVPVLRRLHGELSQAIDIDLTLASLEGFFPTNSETPKMRHKYFMSKGVAGISWAECGGSAWVHAIPYYTQTEVAGGLVGTLRLGFNVGELLDFITGIAGLDLLDDDLREGRAELTAASSTPEPAARGRSRGCTSGRLSRVAPARW